MGEKTLAPKIWAPGAVRSVVPMAPPLGCHCAAMTFWDLVRAMARTLNGGPRPGVVHADNPSGGVHVQLAQTSTARRTPARELPTHVQRPWRPADRGSRS